jgi:hypothetical protein
MLLWVRSIEIWTGRMCASGFPLSVSYQTLRMPCTEWVYRAVGVVCVLARAVGVVCSCFWRWWKWRKAEWVQAVLWLKLERGPSECKSQANLSTIDFWVITLWVVIHVRRNILTPSSGFALNTTEIYTWRISLVIVVSCSLTGAFGAFLVSLAGTCCLFRQCYLHIISHQH